MYTITSSDGHTIITDTAEEAAAALFALIGLGVETATIVPTTVLRAVS